MIFTILFSFLRPINRNYSRLSFDYITYSTNNTGECCTLVIYRHKGKCNILIFILLLFCLSHWKHIQYITRWLFIIFLHFVKKTCVITVSFKSIQLLLWLPSFGASIASLSSPSSHVSALFWYYKNYGLVYVIDMNTHVLRFFLYFFVVPCAQFWTMGSFKVLADCQCNLHSVIIYSSK